MGSVGIILNYALLYGAILLIGALSAYLCERVGIINIGIEIGRASCRERV